MYGFGNCGRNGFGNGCSGHRFGNWRVMRRGLSTLNDVNVRIRLSFGIFVLQYNSGFGFLRLFSFLWLRRRSFASRWLFPFSLASWNHFLLLNQFLKFIRNIPKQLREWIRKFVGFAKFVFRFQFSQHFFWNFANEFTKIIGFHRQFSDLKFREMCSRLFG